MWPWIKHWLDWVTTDVLRLSTTRPHGQAVHTRYEKAGLSLYDLPVPWNADAVIVEVLLRLPPSARKKSDFSVRFPGAEPIAAETLRPDGEDRHRLLFRLPVPLATTTGELLWKQRFLSRIAIPVLTAPDFLAGLKLTNATVAVRLGAQTVAAQAFVASQCKGLIACCTLKSPFVLAPVADLGLDAVFRSERSAAEFIVPVVLSSSQYASREAVVTACPPKHPHRVGAWTVTWRIGGKLLSTQRLEGLPVNRFEKSLRVTDTRFVITEKSGQMKAVRQLPALAELASVGPCFLVTSSEVGMAGLCRLQLHAVVSGDARPSLLLEQDVLITDGPLAFTPGMLEVAELGRVNGFELRHRNRVLGVASLSPVPAAALNAEGGFKPPPEFAWTHAADDELSERLNRLMNGSG